MEYDCKKEEGSFVCTDIERYPGYINWKHKVLDCFTFCLKKGRKSGKK